MKTEFNSEEDRKFLAQLLTRGIMSTEPIIFSYGSNEVHMDYILILINFRKKCFEYLGELDPNEEFINKLEKIIHEQNFEEVKKMGIKVPEYSY